MKQENQENLEIVFKISLLEQQISQLQQQIQIIEQTIDEISLLNLNLDELINSKDREILASIGRGIFVKAKMLSEELIVDVGGKNFVKKSIPETKKLIEQQIEKLEEVRKELNDNLEKIGKELEKIMKEEREKEKG